VLARAPHDQLVSHGVTFVVVDLFEQVFAHPMSSLNAPRPARRHRDRS